MKLDLQHPRSFQSSPMACISPLSLSLTPSSPRAESTLAYRGRCQQTRLCPLSPQNRLGCSGQSMPHPAPLPSSWALRQLWQEEQGPAAAAHMQQSQEPEWQGWRPSLCPAPSYSQGNGRTSQAGTTRWSQPATVSLPLQMSASVLLQPPCQAWPEPPQADTSLSKGPARAWLRVPV